MSAASAVHDPTLSSAPSSPRDASSSGAASPSAAGGSSPARPASSRAGEKFEVASVFVPLGADIDGNVHYTISVVTAGGDRWSVRKRFSAFERLHAVLLELFGHRGFPPGAELPPKKLKFLISHVAEHFIEERRCLLEAYLQKMLKVPEVAKSDVWLDFLSSDELPSYVAPPPDPSLDANLDDCEVTGVSIPQTRLMSDHVLFQVDVVNAKKRRTFSKWTVLKRFGQFFDLDAALHEAFAANEAVLSSLPASPQRASKLLWDHSDPHFIEHRRVLLENYLNKLLHIRAVAQNPIFLTFLGVQV